jgi:hypothetical protein
VLRQHPLDFVERKHADRCAGRKVGHSGKGRSRPLGLRHRAILLRTAAATRDHRVRLRPYGLGWPTTFSVGRSPVGGGNRGYVENGGFPDVHEAAGSHFHALCWKCPKRRRAAISRCPMPFPRTCRDGTVRVDTPGGSSGLRPGSNERRNFRVMIFLGSKNRGHGASVAPELGRGVAA